MLRFGADDTVKGKPVDEPVQTPAFAARRNGNPGIGDLVDAESALRQSDSTRRERQLNREMTAEEFRDSMRGTLSSYTN